MTKMCRIAVVQMKSDTDKNKNLAQSRDYIKEVDYKKAQLVCFPEFQMGFSPSDQKPIELSGISETVVTGNFVIISNAQKKMELKS